MPPDIFCIHQVLNGELFILGKQQHRAGRPCPALFVLSSSKAVCVHLKLIDLLLERCSLWSDSICPCEKVRPRGFHQAAAKQSGRSGLMETSGINPFPAAAQGNPPGWKLGCVTLCSSAEPRGRGEPNAPTLSSRVYLGALRGDKHRPFLFAFHRI